jgi:hypothetical protein
MVQAMKHSNFVGIGKPLSDINKNHTTKAFSSEGVSCYRAVALAGIEAP